MSYTAEWYNSNFVPWINAYWADEHIAELEQKIESVEADMNWTRQTGSYPINTPREKQAFIERWQELRKNYHKLTSELQTAECWQQQRKEYIEKFDWVDWEIKFTAFLGDETRCFGIRGGDASWLQLMQEWYRAMMKLKGDAKGENTHAWRKGKAQEIIAHFEESGIYFRSQHRNSLKPHDIIEEFVRNGLTFHEDPPFLEVLITPALRCSGVESYEAACVSTLKEYVSGRCNFFLERRRILQQNCNFELERIRWPVVSKEDIGVSINPTSHASTVRILLRARKNTRYPDQDGTRQDLLAYIKDHIKEEWAEEEAEEDWLTCRRQWGERLEIDVCMMA